MLKEEDQEEIRPSSQRIHREWKQKSGAYDGNYASRMGRELKLKSRRKSLWILKKEKKKKI